jgi:general secretion pathway protein G
MNDERGTMNDERGTTNGEHLSDVAPVHRSSFIVHRSARSSFIVHRSARSSFRVHRSRNQSGFTLIELIVVVTIIGILAAVAVVNVKNAQRKTREAALKHNLTELRKAIDDFYADKQHYPADLNELTPDYLRKIPKDPITDTEDWEVVMETPDPDAPESTDTDGNPAQPGVIDVKSRAPGSTLNNVPYTDL